MDDVAKEIKLLKAADRAFKAQNLLDDETFKSAFDHLEAEYLNAWRNTGVSEKGQYAREKLWLAINVLGKVREHVGQIVANGKLAKHELAMKEPQRRAA